MEVEIVRVNISDKPISYEPSKYEGIKMQDINAHGQHNSGCLFRNVVDSRNLSFII
jgi:hypothetical protein